MLRVLLDVLALLAIIAPASTTVGTQYLAGSEDANLRVPDLIRKYNYSIEVHHVTTEDGYILEMHRIPHGRDANNDPNITKPVVLLMHGLLCSSAVFVIPGPDDGCGYLLSEEGYDVWMANFRGNTYSHHHVYLNPDSLLNDKFWRFSWEQNGQFDLPAIIEYILKVTGKEKIHYWGHSMGTTAFFVMISLFPKYNSKIICMNALAPVAYMAHIKNPLFTAIAPFANSLEGLSSLIGIGEFLPNSEICKLAGQAFCQDKVVTQSICSNILFLVAGWNESQQNKTLLPIIFGHTPAGASVMQFAHYGQSIQNKDFCRYDFGSLVNKKVYGSTTSPKFDLGKIKVPVFLHYSDNDRLATPEDSERLSEEVGGPMKLCKVQSPEFAHLDFIFGINAKRLVYDKAINLMRSMDNNTFKEEDIDKY